MEKCSLFIKNTIVMTDYKTVKKGMDIAVSKDRIVAVAESGTREFQAEKVISGEGKLFMPGLIDSHMHTGQQLLKGLVLDAKPIIWTRVMLPFESTLTPKKMKLSAQVAALEMMKSGTTGFVDAGSYYMDAAAAVYETSGLRGCLSYSTMDEKGLPKSIAMDAVQAVKETDRLYEDWNQKGNLKVYYSLRALNSCSNELTGLAASHARERGAMLQAHMNEYQGEIDGIIEREGMRPYEYLEKMGVLSSRFLGAHSLILSEEEKQLIKERGVKICHCPFSNCGKAVRRPSMRPGSVAGSRKDIKPTLSAYIWMRAGCFQVEICCIPCLNVGSPVMCAIWSWAERFSWKIVRSKPWMKNGFDLRSMNI